MRRTKEIRPGGLNEWRIDVRVRARICWLQPVARKDLSAPAERSLALLGSAGYTMKEVHDGQQ